MQFVRVYVNALGIPVHVATSDEPFTGEQPIQSADIVGVRALTLTLRDKGFMRARDVLNLLEPATPTRLRWKAGASDRIADSDGDVNPI